jgi:hypothetical protein
MNQKNQLFIIIVILIAGLSLAYVKKTQKPHDADDYFKSDEWKEILKNAKPRPQVPDWAIPKPEEKPPQKIEPEWTEYLPVRSVTGLGKVLSDIDGHMPAGHIYKDNDKITWAHETTHGINSSLRQKFSKGYYGGFKTFYGEPAWKAIEGHPVFHNGVINGFYALENKAAIINEPKTTISTAAALVPQSLRGPVYSLYMVQQATSWNNTPLYIFDEWVAYTNGSACRLDLGIQERSETVSQMLEFDVYATALAMAVKKNDSSYDDKQFKAFLMWNIERSFELFKGEERAKPYLNALRTSGDAEELRKFAKEYYGEDWTKRIMGF